MPTSKDLNQLHAERALLRQRIAVQRIALAQQLAPFDRALHTGERIASLLREGADKARQHPLVLAAAVAALLVLKPRGTLRWVRRGFVLWRGWRSLRGQLSRFDFGPPGQAPRR